MNLTKTFAALALATLLLPATAAGAVRPDLSSLEDGVAAGPCEVRWSWFWPGETLGARCESDGRTLVAASYGTCALGNYLYVQVGAAYAVVPCDLRIPLLA